MKPLKKGVLKIVQKPEEWNTSYRNKNDLQIHGPVFGGFTVFYKFCDVVLIISLFHFHSGELNQDAEKEVNTYDATINCYAEPPNATIR